MIKFIVYDWLLNKMKVLIVHLIFLLKGFKFEKNFDIEKFIIN